MKIKILIPNNQGKLEFDKEELEKLLEESYNEGFEEGRKFNNNLTHIPYYYCGDDAIACSKDSNSFALSSSSISTLADSSTIKLTNGEKNGIGI